MNRPNGKLLALILIVTAVVLVTATGAFTSVTATRTANVDVADDANAVLSIGANQSTASNGKYASTTGTPNQLQIDISGSNSDLASGTGLNPNATTHLYHVFNVTNNDPNGNDKVIYITQPSSPKITFVYNTTDGSGSGTLGGSGKTVTLSGGETVSIGLIIDTQGLSSSYSEDFTIHADDA